MDRENMKRLIDGVMKKHGPGPLVEATRATLGEAAARRIVLQGVERMTEVAKTVFGSTSDALLAFVTLSAGQARELWPESPEAAGNAAEGRLNVEALIGRSLTRSDRAVHIMDSGASGLPELVILRTNLTDDVEIEWYVDGGRILAGTYRMSASWHPTPAPTVDEAVGPTRTPS